MTHLLNYVEYYFVNKNTCVMQTEIIKIKDISDLKIGMFDLGNGNFSLEMPEDRKIRSVVAVLLPDENRAIGLCPTQNVLPWCYTALGVVTQKITSGKEASEILWQEASKRDVTLPALEFCRRYKGYGVTENEAFLPSRTELRYVGLNDGKLRKILRMCGVRILEPTLLSSTINDDYCVWIQSIGKTYSHYDYQCRTYGVCPAVDIVL